MSPQNRTITVRLLQIFEEIIEEKQLKEEAKLEIYKQMALLKPSIGDRFQRSCCIQRASRSHRDVEEICTLYPYVTQTVPMSEVAVRPIGYVEDEPVIRRIGERNLYLGNEHAADSEQHDQSFQYVLSVSTDNYPLTTHHPLDDGPGNDWMEFEGAVDTARRLYRRDGSVLIHCTAGISRSSTVIATALAAEESRQLRDVFSIVLRARPSATLNPALHELAVVYVAARK